MDQQVAKILFPLAILISPLVGLFLGIRHRSPMKSFLVAWGSSILIGSILGAIVTAIVDAIASRMPGGNPWFGHPQGITFSNCLVGALLTGGVSVIGGLVAGLVALAWMFHRIRKLSGL